MSTAAAEKTVVVGPLMSYTGVTARNVAESTGLAYNTILAYRRGSGARIDIAALSEMAQALGLEVFELFYKGNYARPLLKIAQALGLEVSRLPVTSQEYKDLLGLMAEHLGIELEPSDFGPLPGFMAGENYE